MGPHTNTDVDKGWGGQGYLQTQPPRIGHYYQGEGGATHKRRYGIREEGMGGDYINIYAALVQYCSVVWSHILLFSSWSRWMPLSSQVWRGPTLLLVHRWGAAPGVTE